MKSDSGKHPILLMSLKVMLLHSSPSSHATFLYIKTLDKELGFAELQHSHTEHSLLNVELLLGVVGGIVSELLLVK